MMEPNQNHENGYQNGINEPNSDEVENDENLSGSSSESYSMSEQEEEDSSFSGEQSNSSAQNFSAQLMQEFKQLAKNSVKKCTEAFRKAHQHYESVIAQKDSIIAEQQQKIDKTKKIYDFLYEALGIKREQQQFNLVNSQNPERLHVNKPEQQNQINIISQQNEANQTQVVEVNEEDPMKAYPNMILKQDWQLNQDGLNVGPRYVNFWRSIYRVYMKPHRTLMNYGQYNLGQHLVKLGILKRNRLYVHLKLIDSVIDLCYLDRIQGLNLQKLCLQDREFKRITQIKLINLKSLSVECNNIKDITPLRNRDYIDFKKLVNLNVSGNKLNLDSAKFFAEEIFQELIYFTVSFSNNQEAWNRIIQGKAMKNYPRLEAIDIFANDISETLQKKIRSCIHNIPKNPRLQKKIEKPNPEGGVKKYYQRKIFITNQNPKDEIRHHHREGKDWRGRVKCRIYKYKQWVKQKREKQRFRIRDFGTRDKDN